MRTIRYYSMAKAGGGGRDKRGLRVFRGLRVSCRFLDCGKRLERKTLVSGFETMENCSPRV